MSLLFLLLFLPAFILFSLPILPPFIPHPFFCPPFYVCWNYSTEMGDFRSGAPHFPGGLVFVFITFRIDRHDDGWARVLGPSKLGSFLGSPKLSEVNSPSVFTLNCKRWIRKKKEIIHQDQYLGASTMVSTSLRKLHVSMQICLNHWDSFFSLAGAVF